MSLSYTINAIDYVTNPTAKKLQKLARDVRDDGSLIDKSDAEQAKICYTQLYQSIPIRKRITLAFNEAIERLQVYLGYKKPENSDDLESKLERAFSWVRNHKTFFKDELPLNKENRDHYYIKDRYLKDYSPEEITEKLQNELARAQEQMKQEEDRKGPLLEGLTALKEVEAVTKKRDRTTDQLTRTTLFQEIVRLTKRSSTGKEDYKEWQRNPVFIKYANESLEGDGKITSTFVGGQEVGTFDAKTKIYEKSLSSALFKKIESKNGKEMAEFVVSKAQEKIKEVVSKIYGPFAAHCKATVEGKELSFELFGLIEGQGETAAFVRSNIIEAIVEAVSKHGTSDREIYNALREAFVLVGDRARVEIKDGSGAAAVISLKIGSNLWTANLGDSRAILKVGEATIPLSVDAISSDDRFLESLERRGGIGKVHVARGFNYSQIKGMSKDEEMCYAVSSLPKITKIDLSKYGDQPLHLIQASRGVWKAASSSNVAEVVDPSKSSQENANRIVLGAEGINVEAGSSSALVVALKI